MSEISNIPTRDLGGQKVPFEVLRYIPEYSANFYHFVPIGMTDSILEVGMVDPGNIEARDALQFIATKVGIPFKIFSISEADYKSVMSLYANLPSQISNSLSDIKSEIQSQEVAAIKQLSKDKPVDALPEPTVIEEAPVTKIVQVMLQHAVGGNASDIHIEPGAKQTNVRFRVDGALYTSLFLPAAIHEAVVARIKILTNMQLDEKRKPQDGRFSTKVDDRQVDFRVSTFPTYYGEKVVIRILDPQKQLLTLDSLGFDGDNLARIRKALTKPYGIILITGPTGSGKSTSLYSMLGELEKETSNVVSLEDPIEYSIPGVNQSQVRPEIDYTFANGLRSILRQDPDIIMVGEIRDKETAKLAIQAALTGHLVFSTLHTNNTAGVIPRLLDMGVDPYLIAPTLVMAIAQRLVPVICEESKEPMPIDDSLKVMFEKQFADLPQEFRSRIPQPTQVYRAVKSAVCPGGTRGRVAVAEVLEMDKDLERMILQSPGELEIYKMARSKGMITMKEDAMIKALKGIIPFEEVHKL